MMDGRILSPLIGRQGKLISWAPEKKSRMSRGLNLSVVRPKSGGRRNHMA